MHITQVTLSIVNLNVKSEDEMEAAPAQVRFKLWCYSGLKVLMKNQSCVLTLSWQHDILCRQHVGMSSSRSKLKTVGGGNTLL